MWAGTNEAIAPSFAFGLPLGTQNGCLLPQVSALCHLSARGSGAVDINMAVVSQTKTVSLM